MKKDRIIYLDLLRAFAVLMMVQGHTVDSLLADQFRTETSFFYFVWHAMRGFTAPIFMYTAGVVFTYLLLIGHNAEINSYRLKKGFKRVLLLIGLGYLLRYPTYTIINFSNIEPLQWRIFFAVDTLHLIGFGILFILLIAILSDKFRLNKIFSFGSFALLFFIVSPFLTKIEFSNFLHPFFAGYFNSNNGSLFPLFPWVGYVLWGAVLGALLSKKEKIFLNPNFGFTIIGIGFFLIIIYQAYLQFDDKIGSFALYLSEYSILLLRIGFVLLLSGILALISKNIQTVPEIIKTIGRHTLSIYVVHSVILYGSAWSPGLSLLIGKVLNPIQIVFAAFVMLALMIIMAYYFEKIQSKKYITNRLKPLVQSFLVK